MLKVSTVKVIDCDDWDKLVSETYNKPYCLQQQDGCMQKGTTIYITVPVEDPEDYENDTLPEIVNHGDMGVSFKAWLERDPKQLLKEEDNNSEWMITMWWNRNFYPNIDMLINDLHSKGLIETGEYEIKIDW